MPLRRTRSALGPTQNGTAMAILTVGAVTMFVPVVWFVLSAFKTRSDIIAVPLRILPRQWTIEGFVRVWTATELARSYANSLGLALLTLVSVLFTSSLGGYAFARLRFPGRRAIFYFVLSTTMVPFVTLLIPLYLVIEELELRGHLRRGLAPIGVLVVRNLPLPAVHHHAAEGTLRGREAGRRRRLARSTEASSYRSSNPSSRSSPSSAPYCPSTTALSGP